MSPSNFIIRPSGERGFADHGWLKSYHSFSFASYYDPAHMHFQTLRVINEDRIEGGRGFGAHPHSDMEIVSYVIDGGLEHSDSIGNKTVILPDEVQIMSAGSGVTHAEMNHLKDRQTHFFQIWIMPAKNGIKPNYGQKSFKEAFAKEKLVLVASLDKRDGSIGINQDADIYIGRLKSQDAIDFKIRSGRHVWIQMIKGEIKVNSATIKAGDGLAISHETALSIKANTDSEFMAFDMK